MLEILFIAALFIFYAVAARGFITGRTRAVIESISKALIFSLTFKILSKSFYNKK